MRRLDRVVAVGAIVSVAFWIMVSIVSGSLFPGALYYPIWLGTVGIFLWRQRATV